MQAFSAELVFYVWSFLEPQELFVLSEVSTEWNNYLSDPTHPWKAAYKRFFGGSKPEGVDSWKEALKVRVKEYSVVAAKPGPDPTRWAIKNGHVNLVRRLIKGQLPSFNYMCLAAMIGKKKTCRVLMDHGVDVEGFVRVQAPLRSDEPLVPEMILEWLCNPTEPTSFERLATLQGTTVTPFFLACLCGNLEVVKLLLECQRVRAALEDEQATTASSLLLAVAKGRLPIVEYMMTLKHEIKYVATDILLRTALRNDQPEMAQYLLDHGVYVTSFDPDGAPTPLWSACQRGFVGIVAQLLEVGKGTDLGNPNFRTERGSSFRIAVKKRNAEILRLLMKACPDDIDPSCFGLAALRGFDQMLRILFSKEDGKINTDYANLEDDRGYSLLHGASEFGHLEVCKFLLEEVGLDSQGLALNGRTPLTVAVMQGHEELVKLYLDHGAPIDGIPGIGPAIPIRMAAHYAPLSTVEMLVERGASLKVGDPSPIFDAMRNDRTETVEYLLRVEYEMRLKAYASEDPWRLLPVSPFLDWQAHLAAFAASKDLLSILQFLLVEAPSLAFNFAPTNTEEESSPSSPSSNGGSENVPSVRSIVNKFFSEDTGNSLLHWACFHGNLELITLLAECGASFVYLNHDRQSPPQLALSKGHLQALALCLKLEPTATLLQVEFPAFVAEDYPEEETTYEEATKEEEPKPLTEESFKGQQERVTQIPEQKSNFVLEDEKEAPEKDEKKSAANKAGRFEMEGKKRNEREDSDTSRTSEATLEESEGEKREGSFQDPTPSQGDEAEPPSPAAVKDNEAPTMVPKRIGPGWTLLHQAARMGQLAAVQLLLDAGADLNASVMVKDRRRESVFALACRGNHIEVARHLLERGYLITEEDRSSILIEACRRGSTEILNLMIDQKADIDACHDAEGNSLLHTAASHGLVGIVNLLLEKGASVATRNDKGETVLSAARRGGSFACIMKLQEFGAEEDSAATATTQQQGGLNGSPLLFNFAAPFSFTPSSVVSTGGVAPLPPVDNPSGCTQQ